VPQNDQARIHFQANDDPATKTWPVTIGENTTRVSCGEFQNLVNQFRQMSAQTRPNQDIGINLDMPGDGPFVARMVTDNVTVARVTEYLETLWAEYTDGLRDGTFSL
jgi:hypothetical protein